MTFFFRLLPPAKFNGISILQPLRISEVSGKLFFYRTIGDASHTYEEYSTLFSRIEAVLNSRPLCALSSDPNDGPDYLSPGHFLIGSPLVAPPEHVYLDNDRPLTRWHRIQQMHQAFWRRWSTEYLNTQMQRKKWVRDNPSLQVGDVVFLYGTTTCPFFWPIGRVKAIHPGADGITRVVTVQTPEGVFTRLMHKLVSLSLDY